MFSAIFPILQASKKLVLKMEIDPQDPTRMLVCVAPQHPNGDKHPGLNQPVLFKNTPAQLDAEFAKDLAAFTPVYVDTANTVEQSIKALEETKKAAKQAPKSAPSKPGAKPGDKPAATTPMSAAKQAASSTGPAPSALSLFDNLDGGEQESTGDEDDKGDTAAADSSSGDQVPESSVEDTPQTEAASTPATPESLFQTI